MKEVEIKAHVKDASALKKLISSYYGDEKSVKKTDYYFRKSGEIKQSLRIRNNNGNGEVTTKVNSKINGIENNAEYEFHILENEIPIVKDFFRVLGYEDYFIKTKSGYEWNADGVHIELLEVNNLGFFLEMEILLSFSAKDDEIQSSKDKLKELLNKFKIKDEDIESRSYREMILENRVYNIYTDGGSSGNPGPGGWAFVVTENGKEIAEESNGEKLTTNNKMELSAVINALKFVKENNLENISIFSDSQYVILGITKWIFTWKETNWNKGSVKNIELWEELYMLNNEIKPSWNWVKGHAGIDFNEKADKLVRKATEKASLL